MPRNSRPTATYLLPLTIQTANADSRPTNYLRRGDPKGEEGHGGRVEGHHVGDELSVDVERYAERRTQGTVKW